MITSLNQSYAKFIDLRAKLRKIVGQKITPAQNQYIHEQTNLKLHKAESNKIQDKEQFAKTKIQKEEQTERKRNRSEWMKLKNTPKFEQDKSALTFLQEKQKTLNEINKLLQLKQQCLKSIQERLSLKDRPQTRNLDQTVILTSTRVKAPDLYELRQDKKRRQKAKKQLF